MRNHSSILGTYALIAAFSCSCTPPKPKKTTNPAATAAEPSAKPPEQEVTTLESKLGATLNALPGFDTKRPTIVKDCIAASENALGIHDEDVTVVWSGTIDVKACLNADGPPMISYDEATLQYKYELACGSTELAQAHAAPLSRVTDPLGLCAEVAESLLEVNLEAIVSLRRPDSATRQRLKFAFKSQETASGGRCGHMRDQGLWQRSTACQMSGKLDWSDSPDLSYLASFGVGLVRPEAPGYPEAGNVSLAIDDVKGSCTFQGRLISPTCSFASDDASEETRYTGMVSPQDTHNATLQHLHKVLSQLFPLL